MRDPKIHRLYLLLSTWSRADHLQKKHLVKKNKFEVSKNLSEAFARVLTERSKSDHPMCQLNLGKYIRGALLLLQNLLEDSGDLPHTELPMTGEKIHLSPLIRNISQHMFRRGLLCRGSSSDVS